MRSFAHLLPFGEYLWPEERVIIQWRFYTSWASIEGKDWAHMGGRHSAIEVDPCGGR